MLSRLNAPGFTCSHKSYLSPCLLLNTLCVVLCEIGEPTVRRSGGASALG